MKKINVTLFLTTLFFLIIFIGFTEARAGGPVHSKQDKRGSNQIELARQEREVQRKKNILLKKWRQLKPGMTEKQLQKFLGRPKLIQSSSDESVWFYQDVPVSLSDLKWVDYGIVVFEAKSIRDLIEEEKARFDKIIGRLDPESGFERHVVEVRTFCLRPRPSPPLLFPPSPIIITIT